ncbi:MAG TPA: lysylphosphatidylglycerol synthase transmembrane domain-containing protein, partial [bacterium]|nr:lysylphosphatidylglycerol synthase transmembrane domain-containing protein [bacterium]
MGSRSKPSGPLFRALQILVLAAVAFFLGRYLYRLDWTRFWKELSGASPGGLVLSMGLTVLGGLLVAWGWSFILRSLGSFVPHRAAVRIYFLSEMAKYIPGKIWTAVGRAVMLEKWSVPKTVTVSTVGIMLIVLAASGVVVALLSLPFWPSLDAAGISTGFFPVLFLLLPAALILLHPRVFDPVLNWFLRRIERVDAPVHLHYGRTVLLVLYWTGLWLIKGLATWILLAAIFPLPRVPPLPWLSLSGVMAVSWIVGV